ncbi:hypothetical protein ACM55I_14465 [Flavobacterium sp. GB2R13]|uniref:hypothetical protein n=1 Tax=Flavobacterium algoris TaxID=3398733 RepID=UPI003A855DC4
MIKTNIQTKYIHQHRKISSFSDSFFVADYTEQTKLLPVKRSVEFFCPNHPLDIDYFSVKNDNKINVDGIDFDNSSFVCGNGNSRSQCEAVFYPSTSNSDSWVLFCELKYSALPRRNPKNLEYAIRQLYKTRYYYVQNNVIAETNKSYLIGSLPMQREPFSNFTIPPSFLSKLKNKRNIILRLKNSIEISDDKIINV